tara:strand:+ start:5509 stop:5988 length:480 start_codon:yes stop_codon:yes gene_type:complete
MQKTILITGSTDGIGLETAKILLSQGHRVLLHGRNQAKLDNVEKQLSALPGAGQIECYIADLSRKSEVESLAQAVATKHATVDVLINNAGIFHTPEPITSNGLDIRFAVNTLAPYLLTKRLLPLLPPLYSVGVYYWKQGEGSLFLECYPDRSSVVTPSR